MEKVMLLPLSELRPFKNHPFKIQNDEEMERIVESIRKVGVLSPGLARPTADGGYELVSGHRRLAACQQLGLETMPVVVREMTDDEAVIAMVDANLQREHVLPSEKAFAYKMKLEALSHQGQTSGQVGQKWSRDEVSDTESGRQVQRFIRLTNLIPELLDRVDEGKIAFNPAVELSYLSEEQQRDLLTAMEKTQCTPSHAQAIQLKRAAQAGTLDYRGFLCRLRSGSGMRSTGCKAQEDPEGKKKRQNLIHHSALKLLRHLLQQLAYGQMLGTDLLALAAF